MRKHSVKTPNAYYCYFHMEILYVDIYNKIFFSGLYKLMDIHFGSILFCNSNPDADRYTSFCFMVCTI